MLLRLKWLFRLLYNPARAMVEIAAAAPYVFGALLALVATVLYSDVLSRELFHSFTAIDNSPRPRGVATPVISLVIHFVSRLATSASPLVFLTVIFVPACVFAANLIDRRASFLVRLRQDYAPTVSCALYAWAMAQLLMIVPALTIYQAGGPNPQMTEAILRQFAPLPYFLFLMIFALRAALRLGVGRAIGAMALGACSLVAMGFMASVLRLLTSPLLLIMLVLLLRNFFGDLIGAQRAREAFKRNLEIATLNPADASAHYNLGLIHQQRGELDEARRCFTRAIEIDPDETDAHYQLGRISREQGQLSEAITHFDAVVRRDEDHSQGEVWRAIGHTYFDAGQHEDARVAFERFLARRPSDAEGHYRYGLTLAALGRAGEAMDEMRACIEAARTSPSYKYRTDKRWMSEADAFLRSADGRR